MFLKILSLVILLELLLWPANILAENATNNASDPTSRLQLALDNSKITLDDTTKANIVSKCQGAQIVLRNVQLETDKATRRRTGVYNSIIIDLQAIKLRMNRQGSDASETDLLTGKLQEIVDQFTIAVDSYGTTLSDLIAIDCTAQPEQFEAGLILARGQNLAVLGLATKFKQTTNNNLIFEQLKRRLTL